jgi:hypothetical protein
MSDIPPISLDAWLFRFLPSDKSSNPFYKRHPYRNHKDRVDEVTPVFAALNSDIPFGGLALLSKATSISDSILSSWKRHLSNDLDWRPSRAHYGRQRRIFTDEQDIRLVIHIIASYLDHDLSYSDKDFRIEAIFFYHNLISEQEGWFLNGEIAPDAVIPMQRLTCCPRFTKEFRKRHRMKLRRLVLKRRPTTTEAQIRTFTEKVMAHLNVSSRNRIININETNWRSIAASFRTWQTNASESASCHVPMDEKHLRAGLGRG